MAARLADEQEQLEALLRRCAAREAPALEALYRLAAPTLLGCLLRMLRRRALAEEALQDVFVQIWQRASQYDVQRGRPYAWLIGVARYRAIDILRRERAEATDPFELAESVAQEFASDSGAADGALPVGVALHESAALELCLDRLAQEQRASIRLAFLEGRSHPEVAAALSRPLGSVKSWIRRGLALLKECIDACSARAAS